MLLGSSEKTSGPDSYTRGYPSAVWEVTKRCVVCLGMAFVVQVIFQPSYILEIVLINVAGLTQQQYDTSSHSKDMAGSGHAPTATRRDGHP